MIDRLGILALGVIGFLISTYFTLVFYRIVRPNLRIVPRLCRLDERTCRVVLSSREGKLSGLPNAVFGILYYGIIVWTAADAAAISDRATVSRLLIVSLITVATSVYLTYALIAKLKINCSLCFASHFINVALFILLITSGS